MSETTEAVRIARDLRAIEQLYVDLHWQVIASTNDPDFPGGRALNMIGPVANPTTWEYQYEAAEAKVWNSEAQMATFSDYGSDQVASEDHPVFVLGGWAMLIREERNQPSDLTMTLSRATDYLRKSIEWMLSVDEYGDRVFLAADELTRDLNRVRGAMESVLITGTRHDTSAAACFNDPENLGTLCGGQLVRRTLKRQACKHDLHRAEVAQWAARPEVEGEREHPGVTLEFIRTLNPALFDDHTRKNCDLGGRDDVYQCRVCRRRYDEAGYWLAVKQHYERLAG